MDRAWQAGASMTPPATPGSFSVGFPTEGDPAVPVMATEPGAWWFHMVTEELRAIVVGAGLTPSATALNQLKAALDAKYLSSAGVLGVPNGGTGAGTVGGALANFGLIDINSTQLLTADTTLNAGSLGKCFLLADSGSPTPLTITLPSGSPSGSLLMFRVSNGASSLYTLAGSDVGLDGQPNRVLWRGESVLLLKESGNWTRIGGRTIPFRGVLRRASVQSITAGNTWQKALLTSEDGDSTGLALCFDSGNNRFRAPRLGSYSMAGFVSIAAGVSGSSVDASLSLSLNGTNLPTAIPSTFVRSSYAVGAPRVILNTVGLSFPMNAGGYVEMLGQITGSGTIATPTFEYIGSTLVTSLSYEEIPSW